MRTLILIVGMFVTTSQVRNAVITGQLTAQQGQPVGGIRVSLMVASDSIPASANTSTLVSFAMTDVVGRYRLENVPPGRYYVTAGFVETPTYYPGVPSAGAAKILEVSAGAIINGIDFPVAVSAGVTVSGRLRRSPSMSISPSIALIGGSSPPPVAVKPDGTFEFFRIRPGSYSVSLSGGAILSQSLLLSVADRDITGLELLALPSVDISGTVVVEDDGLRPRFQLSFVPYRGGGVNIGASVSTNSTFRTTLAEGEYRVSWANLPAGYFLKSITTGTTDLLANPLRATGTKVEPLVVTLGVTSPPPWVKVSGRVVGSLSLLASGTSRLVLSGSSTVDQLEVPISPNGAFEFPRVLPGAYTARVMPVSPVTGTPVTVTTRDLTDLEILIPSMKIIDGLVTVEGPMAGAPQLSFNLSNSTSSNTVFRAIPQADGTFSVTLPEGERSLALTAPGYAVKSLTYGSADLLKTPAFRITSTDSSEFRVTLVSAPGSVAVPATPILTATPSGTLIGVAPPPQPAPAPLPPPPLPPVPAGVQRIASEVAQANLVSSVSPEYPGLARAARVQGTVFLLASISSEGTVTDLIVLQGHPLLNDAAIQAVKQWRYKPQLVGGQAMPVQTTVTVNFSFQ